MTEYLWSDDRIQHAIDVDASFEGEYGEGIMIVAADNAHATMQEMRDDYEANRDDLQAEIDRLNAELAAANAKIAEYERPLPTMEDGRYKITCDHRFTDEGICVRCGEDAEEWDAGCVESIVNDVLDAEDKLAAKDAELDRLRAELAEARANERKPMRVFRNTLGDDALISYLMDDEGDTDEQ